MTAMTPEVWNSGKDEIFVSQRAMSGIATRKHTNYFSKTGRRMPIDECPAAKVNDQHCRDSAQVDRIKAQDQIIFLELHNNVRTLKRKKKIPQSGKMKMRPEHGSHQHPHQRDHKPKQKLDQGMNVEDSTERRET